MTNFINMLKDESGASAAEYALILAIIGATLAVAAVALGSSIGNAIGDTTTCIESDGTNCP
ncbi:Flp family type IVb pilin [Sphingomicrobium lutaoense]|uniref:Pilus assembly protein Flp/PilA n=1 Tax=Sphingomicrobium lutaoense TaxID=515949 RepID=A0A839Z0A5_9SPHN|nr:Flp family type IVb pilin [Sphingomicrobium lutaoense]MBB3764696.1 pilus assembly protein Flp/PilA [Sphingomicrobium lutaoense]